MTCPLPGKLSTIQNAWNDVIRRVCSDHAVLEEMPSATTLCGTGATSPQHGLIYEMSQWPQSEFERTGIDDAVIEDTEYPMPDIDNPTKTAVYLDALKEWLDHLTIPYPCYRNLQPGSPVYMQKEYYPNQTSAYLNFYVEVINAHRIEFWDRRVYPFTHAIPDTPWAIRDVITRGMYEGGGLQRRWNPSSPDVTYPETGTIGSDWESVSWRALYRLATYSTQLQYELRYRIRPWKLRIYNDSYEVWTPVRQIHEVPQAQVAPSPPVPQFQWEDYGDGNYSNLIGIPSENFSTETWTRNLRIGFTAHTAADVLTVDFAGVIRVLSPPTNKPGEPHIWHWTTIQMPIYNPSDPAANIVHLSVEADSWHSGWEIQLRVVNA